MFSEKRLSGWWEEGGCDVIFNIKRGVRTNFFCFGGGVLSKFLLDNSSFSAAPRPLLIIIAQSLICSLSHRDYFLKLKIYYGELNYELIEEEAAYSVRRVGGSNLNGSFHTIIMIIPKPNVKSLEIVR